MHEYALTFLVTLLGYCVPLCGLLYAVRSNSPVFYAVVIVAFGFLASSGSGRLLPFFGMPILGGSFYFPAVVVAFYYAARIMEREEYRHMMLAVLFGLILNPALHLISRCATSPMSTSRLLVLCPC
jgi:uncharacterized PurR-regulated membrane protein YhhQ (DUF165 family)